MKTKLLIGLLVFTLLAVMISGLVFMIQDASAEVAQYHPPADKPGCDKWPGGPIICVNGNVIPEMVKGQGPPQDKPGCIHWAEDPDTCLWLP